MSIFFTSDLHFGHENSLKFSNRPYNDIHEMNEALIQNINDTVKVKDELWVLGDFAYRISKEEIWKIRAQIKCRHLHLIYGNHDRKYGDDDDIFESVQHYKELKTDYGRVILFHYPMLDWNAKHYGSIHLHGHIHSIGECYNRENLTRNTNEFWDAGHMRKPDDDMKLRMYDVGIDANNYRPVSLLQIAALMGIE